MKPALITRATEVREAPVRPLPRPAQSLAALVEPTIVPAPRVQAAGALVRLGDQLLDQSEAVRVYLELGRVLGLAERDRRPVAWGYLVDWLNDGFEGRPVVELREGLIRHRGPALRTAEDRALVRIDAFTVAHLRRRRPGSKAWRGHLAHYWPGGNGVDRRCPDAKLGFTFREVRGLARALEALAVTP